ncbi:capsular biosynthesis protein [Virgibacillus profundi]|uniref:Capsular biosynthesis protein n=1 Tax=Virgibacillus profundi TaxID=2024555 RepID=A0A2A2IH68_9BACI|nr:CapA family protein [Virgibacillus profundi]PAV30666.1 capsular biosynthesis protein [Virgibacillus profundi]PXY54838.1 CapA family protein [Virgibacillus profundi]
MKRGSIVGLFVVLFILLAGCTDNNDEVLYSNKHESKETMVQQKAPKKIIQEITLSAIGDLLIHSPVFQDAKVEEGYDFTPMLEKVKPYLSNSTVTIANQETMIGGVQLGLSSYPSFNSPYEVGDALKDAGVDVVSLANNHTLDRGEAAIQSAIKHWETIDMMYTGAYKNQKDSENLRVYETDAGISIAFLSYTYGTNGITVPAGKDYLVNLIDKERIASEVAIAKEQADVVALSLHFGNEYERMPNETQKELVQFAADQGVHIVIGHHPHVLQPLEWVTGKDGNKTFVAYSLGNFLSNQQDLYKRIGGILTFSIKKTSQGSENKIEIHSPEFIPTFVTFRQDWADYEVVPMYQLTNEDLSGAANHYKEIKAHMSQWMPELEFVEE